MISLIPIKTEDDFKELLHLESKLYNEAKMNRAGKRDCLLKPTKNMKFQVQR